MTKSIICLRRDLMTAYSGRNTRNRIQNSPLVNSIGSSRSNENSDSRWVISMVLGNMVYLGG